MDTAIQREIHFVRESTGFRIYFRKSRWHSWEFPDPEKVLRSPDMMGRINALFDPADDEASVLRIVRFLQAEVPRQLFDTHIIMLVANRNFREDRVPPPSDPNP